MAIFILVKGGDIFSVWQKPFGKNTLLKKGGRNYVY